MYNINLKTATKSRRSYLNPYKNILKNKIVDGFAEFSQGNYKPLLDLYADAGYQRFAGEHALGGARRGKDKVKQWFERFMRLLPSKFIIQHVYVTGWPWNTVATVQFEDYVSPDGVDPYKNRGVMIAKIRWGKAVEVDIYVDTKMISEALDKLAENGVAEAGLEPIA